MMANCLQISNITSFYNTSLLWFNNHLFVVYCGTIKEFNTSTGSEEVSEWLVIEENVSTRAFPYQGMGNSSHGLQSVPSYSGTHRRAPSSLSSNTLRTYVQSHFHQTTSFLQYVDGLWKLPSKISGVFCLLPISRQVLFIVGV